MEQQIDFSFINKDKLDGVKMDREKENGKWQSWRIPLGNADRFGDQEEALVEFNSVVWKLYGKERDLDEIKEELGKTLWDSAVNKSPTLNETVTKYEKQKQY